MPEQPLVPVDRHAQIITLLRTRDDHLPQPTRRVETPAGFDHQPRERSCPDCLANGQVLKTCETCHGTGIVGPDQLPHVALVDELPDDGKTTDPYADTQGTAGYIRTVTKLGHVPQRDAEIARMRQQTRPAPTAADLIAEANRRGEQWEEARAAKWAAFDYAALDLALEQLRQHDDGAYKLIHAVYVYGWTEASTSLEAIVQRGLRFLDERMPDPIRAPGTVSPAAGKDSRWRGRTERHQQARHDRDQRVIRAHYAWGWSTGQIADHENLTRRRVQQILDAATAVASGPAA